MNEIITQIDDYGRIVQQDRTAKKHRYLLGNLSGNVLKKNFNTFGEFLDYLHMLERTVPWIPNGKSEGLVLDLRDHG